MSKSGLVKKVDNFAKFMQGVEALTSLEVVVGVPEDKSSRKEGEISNAQLAAIHDRGAPEANIPARPFMEPGIKAVQTEIKNEFLKAGQDVSKGAKSINTYLTRIGIIATRSIKNKITEGIPPPLAPSTIAGRIRRVKGKARRGKIAAARAAGVPDSVQGGVAGIFLPLVLSGQLRNAITFVIRKVRKTK